MISVIVPIFNEEGNISVLLKRLNTTLAAYKKPFEIICINDGSVDNSLSLLLDHQKLISSLIIVDFQRNFGQHMAILAGFEHAKGEVIITIDADLQNPPEAIPDLIDKFNEGYDYIGTFRKHRKDSFFRTYASKMINWVREKTSHIQMVDQGCMLRAYGRHIIKQIIKTNDPCTFIPALAHQFATRTIEIPIDHFERHSGESKYNLYRLIRLNFDLITGTSLVPLQLFTICGGFLSLMSAVLVVYLLARRLLIGPEVEGVFTLFAVLFFLVSFLIMGVGIAGEYVGRIFLNVSKKPHYIIKHVYKKSFDGEKVIKLSLDM
jgi:undecaprenyl-phosphate 4-deoxy-4-formamido-L-arabinose transferase